MRNHVFQEKKGLGTIFFSNCNMNCVYCFNSRRTAKQSNIMSIETVNHIFNCVIPFYKDIYFIWHGGEPLLRPISFYKKALKLQKQYARGRHIDNIIQTNGTLINDEWARFFKQNNFLVGVSIDGPKELHDHYRLSPQGEGSWDRVMRGIRCLQKYGVECYGGGE